MQLNRSNLREHHQVDRAGVNHMAPGTASRINAEVEFEISALLETFTHTF
jgi:hypothetical protein